MKKFESKLAQQQEDRARQSQRKEQDARKRAELSAVERSSRLRDELARAKCAEVALGEMLEAVTSQHVETLAKLSAYERATEADRAAASPRPPRSFDDDAPPRVPKTPAPPPSPPSELGEACARARDDAHAAKVQVTGCREADAAERRALSNRRRELLGLVGALADVDARLEAGHRSPQRAARAELDDAVDRALVVHAEQRGGAPPPATPEKRAAEDFYGGALPAASPPPPPGVPARLARERDGAYRDRVEAALRVAAEAEAEQLARATAAAGALARAEASQAALEAVARRLRADLRAREGRADFFVDSATAGDSRADERDDPPPPPARAGGAAAPAPAPARRARRGAARAAGDAPGGGVETAPRNRCPLRKPKPKPKPKLPGGRPAWTH